MAVAKSYQNLTIIGEPFFSSGKMFVLVKNEKTNMTRQVRWYTDAEYQRLYGEAPREKVIKTQKQVLGFVDGFITIFKGKTYPHLQWFKDSSAKYNKLFGWFFPSDVEIPADLPAGVAPIKLEWDKVGDENGVLNPEWEVKKVIESLIYDAKPSEFVGSIGERITVAVKLVNVYTGTGYYGDYAIHSFEDKDGNQLVWSTSHKKWEEGTELVIRGTVKEHKVYRNTKQTSLSRCMEVK